MVNIINNKNGKYNNIKYKIFIIYNNKIKLDKLNALL